MAGEPQKAQGAEKHEEEVHSRQAISAHVVYEAILREGEEELERPTTALAFSGLAAGSSMGFSLVTQALLQQHLPSTEWRPLVSKLGYSVGFLIVVLGRQQLFTENTLTPVLSFLRHKQFSVFLNLLRLWAAVYIANIVGALLFACALAHTSTFDPELKSIFSEIGHKPIEHGFLTVFLRAIFAGWLVALMVWLLPFAESARIWVIAFLTYLIGIGQLTHIIAGSVDVLYLVVRGELSVGGYLNQFMWPTLLGNIVGGVSLVAVLNHAQVVAGKDESTDA
jgi:formate/nitrite transporter FocA (FNT family)